MPKEVYEAVLRRDRGVCQAAVRGFAPEVRCKGKLHCHHTILRSQGGKDIPEHLLMICAAHHRHAHDVDRAGAERFLIIIPQEARPAAVSPG